MFRSGSSDRLMSCNCSETTGIKLEAFAVHCTRIAGEERTQQKTFTTLLKHLKVNKQKRKREVKGKCLELTPACPEASESLVLILLLAWGIHNSFKKCGLYLDELTVDWKFKDLYRSG